MGLIARGIEEGGLPTVYLGSCRDIMNQVKAPRSVFIDFPLGRQCGKAGNKELQGRILRDALNVLVCAKSAGTLVRLDYEWDDPFDWESYMLEVKEMLEQEGERKREWEPD